MPAGERWRKRSGVRRGERIRTPAGARAVAALFGPATSSVPAVLQRQDGVQATGPQGWIKAREEADYARYAGRKKDSERVMTVGQPA